MQYEDYFSRLLKIISEYGLNYYNIKQYIRAIMIAMDVLIKELSE